MSGQSAASSSSGNSFAPSLSTKGLPLASWDSIRSRTVTFNVENAESSAGVRWPDLRASMTCSDRALKTK